MAVIQGVEAQQTAAQGGGDDGHLGRAAGAGTGHAVGQVDEEGGDARPLQERAEDDEEDDVGVADAHRGADDAAGGRTAGSRYVQPGI